MNEKKIKVVAGIATISERKNNLKSVINSIINQVDKLIIYQNGYKEIFEFLQNEKIEIISSLDTGIDNGDAGKFFKISELKNCYYFSIDDDIIYPKNYVNETIKNLKTYNDEVIVTYHGRILKPNAQSYYKDYLSVFHFSNRQNKDNFVHFGGTGVMAFNTEKVKLSFSEFKIQNVADIFVGIFAQKNNIPIICLKREENWLTPIKNNGGYDIFTHYSNNEITQNELIKSYDKSKITTCQLPKKNILTNTKLSIITPTFDNVEFLPDYISSILKSIKNLNCEILIGIDGCEKTLKYVKENKFDSRINFFYFKENVGPYIIKNTLVSISNSSNILFFDSDDIMNESIIIEVIRSLETFGMYKPKYINFSDINDTKKPDFIKKSKIHYGEGVFAIKKEFFLDLNGFEGWRCAADSDFMSRIYKRGVKFKLGGEISFFRRVHQKSLTVNPKTSLGSSFRKKIVDDGAKLNRPFGKCKTFKTEKFTKLELVRNEKIKVLVDNVIVPDEKVFEKLQTPVEKLKGILKSGKPKGVDYEKINDTLKQQGIYNPNLIKEKPKIKQNNPIDRNKLIEIKKGSAVDSLRTNLPNKPNRRKDLPNIFSKKNKN